MSSGKSVAWRLTVTRSRSRMVWVYPRGPHKRSFAHEIEWTTAVAFLHNGASRMASSNPPLNLGAHLEGDGVRFNVYAPKCKEVGVWIEKKDAPLVLERGERGLFTAHATGMRAGARYKLRLDDADKPIPDPASRYQPDGPHGFSQVVDHSAFKWTDAAWRGCKLRGQVIYEMHVGTFTKDGSYRAASTELAELKESGITLIELMPLAEFPGRFGWGYDGVQLYAPYHGYGQPDDLRAFIDAAHSHGIGVILDVVYNHFGPDGNYLNLFSDQFFTDKYINDWGKAIDFETSPDVRAFFTENAAYWVRDYHFDGLRLDATQNVQDATKPHIIQELISAARAAAGTRDIVVVAENEPQDAQIARPLDKNGFGGNGLWNDDFHHAAIVALTGRKEAYYSSTKGTPQELVSALRWGYLFQGQYYPWQKQRRGSPALDLDPPSFIVFLENHDQIANTTRGERPTAFAAPTAVRALTTALLLAPSTPMFFQGQEFGARTPFRYFADHEPDLAAMVKKGRVDFLKQFPSANDPHIESVYVAPNDPKAFADSKLDFTERETNASTYAFHKALLKLRRTDPVFSAQRSDWMYGAVLGDAAFVLRFATGSGNDRLIIVNLGKDLDLSEVAEPLLAPPDGAVFGMIFSTEDARYGGSGTRPLGEHGQVHIAAHSALVLAPQKQGDPPFEHHKEVEGP